MSISKFYQVSACLCGASSPLCEHYSENETVRIVTCSYCFRGHVEYETMTEPLVSGEPYDFTSKVITNDFLQGNDLRASARG